VLGEAEDGRMIQRLARELLPDVIIMDVAMPDLNGIEATGRLSPNSPGSRSSPSPCMTIRRFVFEYAQGRGGRICSRIALSGLAKAIRVVMSHKTYLSHEVADIVVKDYLSSTNPQEPSVFQVLSPREREVLQLIAEGKTSAKIARACIQHQNRRNPSPTGHG